MCVFSSLFVLCLSPFLFSFVESIEMVLTHGHGNLRPNVVLEHGDPFTSNDPSQFPDSESEFRDFSHLWV